MATGRRTAGWCRPRSRWWCWSAAGVSALCGVQARGEPRGGWRCRGRSRGRWPQDTQRVGERRPGRRCTGASRRRPPVGRGYLLHIAPGDWRCSRRGAPSGTRRGAVRGTRHWLKQLPWSSGARPGVAAGPAVRSGRRRGRCRRRCRPPPRWDRRSCRRRRRCPRCRPTPQEPQFLGSVWVATQVSPQRTVPVGALELARGETAGEQDGQRAATGGGGQSRSDGDDVMGETSGVTGAKESGWAARRRTAR